MGFILTLLWYTPWFIWARDEIRFLVVSKDRVITGLSSGYLRSLCH
jgi:hypothetical protein